MATSIIDQLKKEIASRRDELKKLEDALAALTGGKTGKGKGGGVRKPRTAEQKAAAAERMKAIWAAKKSGKPAAKKTKAKVKAAEA